MKLRNITHTVLNGLLPAALTNTYTYEMFWKIVSASIALRVCMKSTAQLYLFSNLIRTK